jgi:hypothetical protein
MRLIGRWRTIMNRTLEDTRAFAGEEVADLMEEFVSAMVKLSTRRPDGNVVVEASAIESAENTICPVYPFCDR